jgi:acyl-CoA thioesterase-2
MSEALAELLDLLRLDSIEENVWRGRTQDLGWGRVFGGLVIAQAMVAAAASVGDRPIHSLHAYFLTFGDTTCPIDYRVETIREGSSFSVRRVAAQQAGRTVFIMSASFHKDEYGLDHHAPMPDVAGPEDLPSETALAFASMAELPEKLRRRFARDWPIESRPIDPVDLMHPNKTSSVHHIWLRANGSLPDDRMLHRCLLAYISDARILTTSLRPHGKSFLAPEAQLASLDHAMWFHRDFKMDSWLLYALDSPSAFGARGFGRGSVFARDGKLVASVAQEGLIRFKA